MITLMFRETTFILISSMNLHISPSCYTVPRKSITFRVDLGTFILCKHVWHFKQIIARDFVITFVHLFLHLFRFAEHLTFPSKCKVQKYIYIYVFTKAFLVYSLHATRPFPRPFLYFHPLCCVSHHIKKCKNVLWSYWGLSFGP